MRVMFTWDIDFNKHEERQVHGRNISFSTKAKVKFESYIVAANGLSAHLPDISP